MILDHTFYERTDVITIARELLGKVLYTKSGRVITSGIITETEAYAGAGDKASHAYNNRRTNRNEAMYNSGGTAYVYLCYGIHYLFNVVTNVTDVPHAVLIRAIQPLQGIDTMMKRRKKNSIDRKFSSGPGTLTQALGITMQHNRADLTSGKVWIEDRGISVNADRIVVTPRIGIDYAAEDAQLPYRFVYQDKIES